MILSYSVVVGKSSTCTPAGEEGVVSGQYVRSTYQTSLIIGRRLINFF